jgi:hypothetical protein
VLGGDGGIACLDFMVVKNACFGMNNLVGLEWVWIDIVMISREPLSRRLAINSMNFVNTC